MGLQLTPAPLANGLPASAGHGPHDGVRAASGGPASLGAAAQADANGVAAAPLLSMAAAAVSAEADRVGAAALAAADMQRGAGGGSAAAELGDSGAAEDVGADGRSHADANGGPVETKQAAVRGAQGSAGTGAEGGPGAKAGDAAPGAEAAPIGPYSQRDMCLAAREAAGDLAFHYVRNDGQPDSSIWCAGSCLCAVGERLH